MSNHRERDMPAFPCVPETTVCSGEQGGETQHHDVQCFGLTKLEYTAIQIAQGMMAHNDCTDPANAISCAERLWDKIEGEIQ